MRSASLFLVAGLAACTTSAEFGTADAAMEARGGSFGLLRVDRAEGSAQVSAAFARHLGVDGRDVLALLGQPAVELGECAPLATEAPDVGLDAEVELLDAGPLELRIGDASSEIRSRTFPELGDVVGGAFYAGEVSVGDGASDMFVLRSRGSRDVGSFDVGVASPAPVGALVVDRVAVPAGESALVVARAAGVDLVWDATDPADRVEVEVATPAGGVLCVGRDTGSLRISATDLLRVAAGDGQLTVRRLRMQPLDVDGVDTASAVVSTSRVLAARLR